MVTVPLLTPLTSPVEGFTNATAVLLLVHKPPVTELLSNVVLQTSVLPVIDAGMLFTLAAATAVHPAAVVYVMLLLPPDTPVSVPDASIVATDRLLLLHDPPTTASLNDDDAPAQIIVVPVIGAIGLMVTVVVALQPPGVL